MDGVMNSATNNEPHRGTPVTERTIASRTVFSGRLLTVEVLDVELEPGIRATRDIIRHAPAVALVAQCPDGRFILVRQFRKATEQFILEIVAGGIEPNENPTDCARREIREETGHEVLSLRPLGHIYPTPGYNNEIIHLYFAKVSAERDMHHQGDHDERIAVEYFTLDQFEYLLQQGQIIDAKTLAAWLLFIKAPQPQENQKSA